MNRSPETSVATAPASLAERTGASERFWWKHLTLPLLVRLAGLCVFEFTDVDLYASDLAYDFDARRWPLRRVKWIEPVLHDGGKYLVAATAFGALLVFLLSFAVPRLARWRRAALYLALCVGLSTGCVQLLKRSITRHYPISIERYGGDVPYTRLFEAPPAGVKHVGGFPGAHVSGALSLCGLYFIARAHGVRRPSRWLLPALVLGIIYGGVQHVRGLHYLSHNWWSAGICWWMALGLYLAFRRRV